MEREGTNEVSPKGLKPHLKVNPVPAVTPCPQKTRNEKEREITKEVSTTLVINDLKVNLLDSESGSFYALCPSCVHNSVPHEIQPSFVGNVAPLLARHLPASVIDSRISEKDNVAEDEDSEEEKAMDNQGANSGLYKIDFEPIDKYCVFASNIEITQYQVDYLTRISTYKPCIPYYVCRMSMSIVFKRKNISNKMYFSKKFTNKYLEDYLQDQVYVPVMCLDIKGDYQVKLKKGMDNRAIITTNWIKVVENKNIKKDDLCVFAFSKLDSGLNLFVIPVPP